MAFKKKVLVVLNTIFSNEKTISDLSKKYPNSLFTLLVREDITVNTRHLAWNIQEVIPYRDNTSFQEIIRIIKKLRSQNFNTAIYIGPNQTIRMFLVNLVKAEYTFFFQLEPNGSLQENKLNFERISLFFVRQATMIFSWLIAKPITLFIRISFMATELLEKEKNIRSRKLVQPFRPEEMDKISVVIPNYNGIELLQECLPSIIGAVFEHNPENEIIVVDDASTDNSIQFLKDKFPKVKIVANKINMGFGKTANKGVANSSNRLVVLLNSDIASTNNFITPLIKHFHDQDVFTVQPKMFSWNKDEFNGGMNMGRMKNGYINIWNEAQTTNAKHVDSVSPNLYAIGGAMIFDKVKWDLLGGFDDIFYPFCWEDIDISYRALKRGWKVLYDPNSTLLHKHHGTLAKVFKADFRKIIEQKNEMLFTWKNIHDKALLHEHFMILPGMISERLFSGDSSFFKAFIKAFFNLKGLLKQRKLERANTVFSDHEVLRIALRHYRKLEQNNFDINQVSKKQILFLTPFMPYPAIDGGKIRVFTFLKLLSTEFDIHLLTFINSEEENKHIEELKKYCKKVDTILIKHPSTSVLFRALYPIHFRPLYSTEFIAKLKEILDNRALDLVQIEFTQMVYYVNFIKNIPKVFTEHDVGVILPDKSYIVSEKGWRKVYDIHFYLQTLRWFIINFKKFEKIIVVTDKDKDVLVKLMPKLDVSILTTGTEMGYFSREYKEINENRLVFVGSMGHYPNVAAVLYFYFEIFPLIKKQIENVRFIVVGSGYSKEVHALSKDPSVEITGYVADIRPYVSKSSVFVVPMTKGSGIKGKILEAMAMRVPIVTTPIGCRGLPAEPEQYLYVAKSAEEFAEKTVHLLRNPEIRKKMAFRSYEIVKKHFDWKMIAKDLSGIYNELIEYDNFKEKNS